MKKLVYLSILICSTLVLKAQVTIDESEVNPIYLKFLPSDVNPEDLRPADIPSEQVLKQMGLSNAEIKEALNFKYSKGKYARLTQDTLGDNTMLSKFYASFQDTLVTDSISFPKGKIYGQDVFRNNQLSFYQKALDAKAPEHYKVGPGDEISISVWGYSVFSETLEVDERGYITPSSYGRIYVKGLTFKRMKSVLKNKFSSFLDMKNSEIDVTLSYSRVITVHIVGEVYSPGSYTIPAINTAFNALMAANGPNQLGSVRNIYIKRNGKTVDSLDVYQFLFNPVRSQDIYLQDGDYLFVPPAKDLVEVKGAINRPYTYEVKSNESVADLILYTGGFTVDAFTDILTLKRIVYNTIRVNDLHKDDIESMVLQHGDELVINRISNKLANVVSIKGNVGVAGDYEFVKGERLFDLLNKAKCITQKTFLDKAYIARLNEDRTKSHISVNLNAILEDQTHKDNILLKEYDVIRVLSVTDFDDNFIVSVYGAVRKPAVFDYGDGITLQDVLLQAGGLSQQAEGSRVEVSRIMDYDLLSNKLKPKRVVVKTVKIGSDLVLSEEAQEFVLKPFDQVFVRENPDFEPAKNIVLLGEVKYPGTYTLLAKDEKIASVIKRAGGLTNYAYLDGIRMYRKFEVIQQVEEEDLEVSQKLKAMIMESPELALLYAGDIKERSTQKESIFGDKEKEFAYDVVYLNTEKAISSSSSKHNLVLVEGDSIIVPKTMDVVHITGDLMNLEGNSISAPYFGSRRANYYVNNFAGGFTKKNKKGNTVVVYPNGIAKKTTNYGLFSISPRVKKGATIKVVKKVKKTKLEKEKIDWNAQIENAMLKVSAILTLWLLIDRVAPQ